MSPISLSAGFSYRYSQVFTIVLRSSMYTRALRAVTVQKGLDVFKMSKRSSLSALFTREMCAIAVLMHVQCPQGPHMIVLVNKGYARL